MTVDYMKDIDLTMAREILAWEPGSLRVRKMERQCSLDLEGEQARARERLETGRWPA